MSNFYEIKIGKDGIKFNFPKLQEYIMSLPVGNYWLEIKKAKSQRTLYQNAWYWGAILPLIAETYGHTPYELHEIFKRMFLEPRFIKYKGKEIKIPGSTAKLSKIEFGEYVEKIRAECSQDGITIPEPK